jgi:uncharacterized coiled-coil protein SlyX
MKIESRLELQEKALTGLAQRLSESELNSRELRNRIDAITPKQIKQVESRVSELNKRLAQSILISATIEQVALLLDHRKDKDGIKVVAWLSRKATDEPGWFKKHAEKMSLAEIIKHIKDQTDENN